MKIDAVTKRWIRNAADEKAARNGCRFDEERGQFVVDWMAECLCLWEGEQAGEPMIALDWQFDCTMRGFGWVKFSPRWKREIRRFTVFSIFKPKKQKKSPTMAAWGLYLLCADGEPGQKVFAGSKDGKQSKENVLTHAREMALASPQLLEECTVGPNQITHNPTRSIFRVLTAHDAATQKSKEGINGSILIDETHVVDRAFIARISRAGISRSEPLRIEVSTSGNDPESYGKQTWDYGHLVNAGEHDDETLLFDVHAAPEELSDEDLAKDPIKYGKIANPSWGHTVNEEEFLADYQRSKVSLRELADFKMYRLNIWQSASNPAIHQTDWNACYEDFNTSELDTKPCYAALDLGFKWDTSSLQLWFPWGEDAPDEDAIPLFDAAGEPVNAFTGASTHAELLTPKPRFRLLSYFWLPKLTADKEGKQIQWHQWAGRRDVTLTDGNSADFPRIIRDIVALSKRFRFQVLNYDERFAQVMAQELQDSHGLHVQSFAQSAPSYNAPCRAFEQIILDRRVAHRGNRVMNWQVGNLAFKDRGGLLLPSKPEANKLARIDGAVAAIMGLDAAIAKQGVSWYEPGSIRD